MQIKKVIKALEDVAQEEQLKLQQEIVEKEKQESTQNKQQNKDLIPTGFQDSLGQDFLGRPGGGMGLNKMMYMNYNQLNTIEEEKHETQNSNYFRDADSENNIASSYAFKDSHILKESDNKQSPNTVKDYNFQKKDEQVITYIYIFIIGRRTIRRRTIR